MRGFYWSGDICLYRDERTGPLSLPPTLFSIVYSHEELVLEGASGATGVASSAARQAKALGLWAVGEGGGRSSRAAGRNGGSSVAAAAADADVVFASCVCAFACAARRGSEGAAEAEEANSGEGEEEGCVAWSACILFVSREERAEGRGSGNEWMFKAHGVRCGTQSVALG